MSALLLERTYRVASETIIAIQFLLRLKVLRSPLMGKKPTLPCALALVRYVPQRKMPDGPRSCGPA